MQEIYNELASDALECSTWTDRAQILIGIWAASVVAQSEIILRNAELVLATSEETYTKYLLLRHEIQFLNIGL